MNKIQDFISNLRQKPFIQSLISDLKSDIYVVGGATRDLILNKPNKDIDLVIGKVDIDVLISHLKKFGKVDVVGKSFGVIKFIDSNGIDYDIALPRRDAKNDKGGYRGFDVQSDKNLPIEDELVRRDAKMNAMAINLYTGKFIDPLGGLNDIENKQISAANPEAFSDDPLRMLRIISFASRFDFIIEPKTMQMIIDNSSKINEIASERILIELDKILRKGNIPYCVELLSKTGLFKQIFGNGISQSQISQRNFNNVKTIAELLFLMMHDIVQNLTEFYLQRFATENAKRDKTYKELQALEMAYESLSSNQQIDEVKARSIAHNMFKIAPQTLDSQILPQQIKIAAQELLQGKYPKTVNDLAINGNDLIQQELTGKAIGNMQKSMLIWIYADKVRNNREELLSLVNNKINNIKEGYGNYSKPPNTWDINGEPVTINFFVKEYDKWNNQNNKPLYPNPSRTSVLEFLQNNYEDESSDENLKKQLYWALTDRDLLKEEKKNDSQIEYGCLMLYFNIKKWNNITSIINKDDLYKVDDEYGIETEPHITILYGFHKKVTADDIFSLYKNNFKLKPIEVKVNGISIFKNKEFDVVKLDVESKILTKLNDIMKKLPNTSTYPEYHPHITIGYVKKGMGKKYVETFSKKLKLIANKLVFSTKDEEKKELLLNKNGLLTENNKEMKKVNYSAIVIDNKSRNRLVKVFWNIIPSNFEIIAHHMTIKMGALEDGSREKQDMIDEKEIHINVTDYAMDDKVIAVGVKGYPSTNEKPHITIAVNRAKGGKPYMSNKLTNWRKMGFSFDLTGKIQEI